MDAEPQGLDEFLGADRAPAGLVAVNQPEPPGLDAFLAEDAPAPPSGGSKEPPGLDAFLQNKPDLSKYETPWQQDAAKVEGLLRGATLGLSDVAETKLGISTPQAISGRQQANPWQSGLTSGLGAAGIAAITGGGSLAAEAMGGGALAGAVGLGAEGAVFGAGNAISEAALGDPDLNAEKVLSHIGWGAALGAGLGAVAGHLGAFAGKASDAAAAVAEDLAPGHVPGEPAPIMAEPIVPKEPINSYADLEKRITEGKARGDSYELPQKAVIEDTATRLTDLHYPPLPQQIEALGSKSANDSYRILRESDTNVGRTVQNYEALQKAEATNQLEKAIQSLSPINSTSTDEVLNGNKAVAFFTEQYQKTKKLFAPLFDALDEVHLGDIRFDIDPFFKAIDERVPGISRMFKYDESGYIGGIEKYNSAWGIDKATYNAAKEAYAGMMGSAGESFNLRDFLNIRKAMDQHVNFTQGGQAAKEIMSMKAVAMDYAQKIASEQIEEGAIREAFKSYAINEQNREIVEKAFGASVGNPDFARLPKAKEYILGKIFKDSVTTAAAKRMLPPHQFDELLANYLTEEKFALTKNGQFSSNRFLSFLRNNRSALDVALEHNRGTLQRIKDLTTFSTIIPDNASINPSGTAKTAAGLVKNMLGNISLFDLALAAPGLAHPLAFLGVAGKKVIEMLKASGVEKNAINQFNQGLVGEAARAQSLAATKKILDAVTANMDRGAKAIFKGNADER